ncbi:hypothetical protein PG994_011762 [Apiospora phragmitis]|uniref:GST N-terminal domain-containing protein n=1 Tax=Apiospora phragmitis TaxID=2905665 RepID=A0ABR1TU26_9PEZI
MDMDPSSTTFATPHPLVAHTLHHGLPDLESHHHHQQQQQQQQQQYHGPPMQHQHAHLAHHHHHHHQHHASSPPPPPPNEPPPPPHFSLPTLSSNTDIGLVLDGPDPSFYLDHAHSHAHLQRLQTATTVPILQHGPQQQQPPPPPAQQLHQQHHHALSASPVPVTVGAPPPPPPPPPPPMPPSSHPQPANHGIHVSQGPFNILTPGLIAQLQQEEDYLGPGMASSSSQPPKNLENRPHGQLVNRIIPDPPNLEMWREKLFHVDDMIILTNDEFETYFPHIDNVYSHRSTQKYKRKPFISHYWDCRMKGRPPGTPKSDDPSKKKRKRNARERDLCDVKIKITEYFAGATIQLDDGITIDGTQAPLVGDKFWTIQRVNGNGGNGKQDGVAGPHKHSLAKSDEIKKSTVQRFIQAQGKEAKKTQKPTQRRATGAAQLTVKKHSKEHELKLYAACFCPFSQRVWIALEVKGMQYQYCETDPFKRPTHLLEANPRGMVPAIREGDWASGESAVILEYLEDRDHHVPLLPTDPRLKANCRLWIDHINAKIVPSYFNLLRATDTSKQSEGIDRLQTEIRALVQAADERGPYFLGADLCLVDIHFAPFVLRLSRMLRQHRHWSDPMPGTRWHMWIEALERNPHIMATTSSSELYLETFDLFMNSRLANGES